MFVDEDVDVALPPLPLPLDWSSRIPVSGMSSMMSPPAIDGMAAETSAMTVKTETPRKRRLMDAGIPCPPFCARRRVVQARVVRLAGRREFSRAPVRLPSAMATGSKARALDDDRAPVAS